MTRLRQWDLPGDPGVASVHGVAPLAEDALALPVFDSENEDHVPHVREDWSTYATPSDINTTNRVDGGESWEATSVPHNTFEAATGAKADLWYGASKALVCDLQDSPAEGQAHSRAVTLHVSASTVLNFSSAHDSLVIEWAFWQSGTADYAGKIADWQPQGTPNLWRLNFQTNFDGLGTRPFNHTDADPLCFAYYTNDGTVRRWAGIPTTAGRYGYQWARANNDLGTLTHWNQNCGWLSGDNGSGGGFDYAGGNHPWASHHLDATARRIVIRLTLNEPGQSTRGYGRMEAWYQRAGSSPIQFMRYLGDAGTLDAENGRLPGLVDVGDPNSYWFNASGVLYWYNLTGQNDPGVGGFYLGGTTLGLLGFRMWSHPRIELS